jgi:hypothetical protein
MLIRALDKSLAKALLAGLFLVLWAFNVTSIEAQSGRRPNPLPPAPIATPTPEPTPQEKPKPEIKPDYTIKVVSFLQSGLYQYFAYPENMPRWVVERLRSSKSLEVEYQSSANRKEAVEMAKNSTEAFVLLVELESDPFASASSASGSVWINFYVYTPGTGKTKQWGRSELKPELLNNNRRILSTNRNCSPTNNADYLLWQASFEVAERVMSGFNVPATPYVCK